MFRRLMVGLLAALLVIAAIGIQAQEADDDMISRICLVLNIGQIDDGTFNQSAYEGMTAIAEDYALLPEEVAFLTSEDTEDHGPNIQQCIEEEYDIIITVGFQLADLTLAAAEEHPDRYFIGIDQFVMDGPENYVGIQFREDQAGFLVGYLAGLVTESNIVAGVYGPPIPPVVRWRNGFEQGVRHAAAETDRQITILGRHLDDFNLAEEGEQAAADFLETGADVVFGAGGLTGSSAIQHAAQQGAWVIGVDQDEYYTTFQGGAVEGADRLITSGLKRVSVGVYDMLAALLDGNLTAFPGGENYILTVENSGIAFANPHDAEIPREFLDRLIEVEAMLAADELSTGVDPVTGDVIAEVQPVEATPEMTAEAADEIQAVALLDDNFLADTSFITGEPCGPPCWNNITPGVTGWEEASTIIQENPDLTDWQENADEPGGRRGAAWAAGSGQLCCQMFSDEQGEFVELILLQTAPQATLQEAIDVLGEPDYLMGQLLDETQGIVSLFYEDTPMLLYTLVTDADSMIDGESQIIGFAYLTPTLMEELVTTSVMETWQGYASYDDYFGSGS